MNRAEKAQATIDHDYIKSAFSHLEANCHQVIAESSHDQNELREDMYYMLRALKSLRAVFMHHIREGKAQDLQNVHIKRIKR